MVKTKKTLILWATIIAILVIVFCPKANPFKAFDPEGSIIKGYYGEKFYLVQLRYLDFMPYDDFETYAKDVINNGVRYKFSYLEDGGKIVSTEYLYDFQSKDAEFQKCIQQFDAIKKVFGEPDSGIGNLTLENISEAVDESDEIKWVLSNGFSIVLYAELDESWGHRVFVSIQSPDITN